MQLEVIFISIQPIKGNYLMFQSQVNENKDYKDHKSSYSVSKEKILKTYKEATISSHSNYTNEPVKGHKRSSSDSQKLYDLNKWNNFVAPLEK